jgi:hypothetical protein
VCGVSAALAFTPYPPVKGNDRHHAVEGLLINEIIIKFYYHQSKAKLKQVLIVNNEWSSAE